MKLLANRQTGTTSYFKQVFKTFQENYRILLNILSRPTKQFLQCKWTIKSVIYFTTELKEGPENLNESRRVLSILGDPGVASRDHGIFMGESLQQERESPWALTLTERVPEAFEIPPSDWPEKFFSGQLAKRNSRATQMSSYTRLFSSSIAVVAWPVQREHF